MCKLHIQSCLLRGNNNSKEKMVEPIVHIQQLGKKRIGPFGYPIIAFFGATSLYKKNDDVQ
jgi:hypothetical protein